MLGCIFTKLKKKVFHLHFAIQVTFVKMQCDSKSISIHVNMAHANALFIL